MKADLHLHTHRSPDGVTRPDRLVRLALERGVGLVAVTDHDSIRGGELARAAARGTTLTVVVGAELTTDAGHIQGLCLRHDVLPDRPRPLPWWEAVAAVHAQGGLAVWVHPCRTDRALDPGVLAAVDAVEVWNGRLRWSRYAGANERAALAWATAAPPLLATAGSDGHCPAEVGAVCLEGPEWHGPASAQALRAWLGGAGAVWASRPPALCQTHSQLRKAARSGDAALALRALGRALVRWRDTLTPPTRERQRVWDRPEPEATEGRGGGAGDVYADGSL